MGLSLNRTVWKYMFFIFAGLTVAFALLFHFEAVFISLLIGFIFIILINRSIYVFNLTTKKYSKNIRRLIAFAVISFLILFVFFFLLVQTNNALTSLNELYELSSEYYETSNHIVVLIENALMTRQILGIDLSILTNTLKLLFLTGSTITDSVSSSITSVSSVLVTAVFTVPFMLLYYYTQKENLICRINKALPYDLRQFFWVTVSSVVGNLNLFVTLKLFEMVILSILYGFGFYLSGTSHWVFFAIFLSLFSIIPYVGFIFGSIPVCILAYILNPPSLAYVVVTILLVQIFDIFFILPKMVSDTVRINPLLAVLLTLMAWHVFGLVGLVVTIPIYLIYKIVLTSCYNELVKVYPNKSIKFEEPIEPSA